MSRYLWLTMAASLLAVSMVVADDPNDSEEGFVSLFDGQSFDGWKMSENTDSWSIKEGAIVAKGERSHLFYVGDDKPFKNFILKVDCMTLPNSNGGIYFHTRYQEDGWPTVGYEAQVNNTHGDPKRTGSLYGVSNVLKQHIPDNEWWTQTIMVQGSHIQISLNGEVVVDYNEPPCVQAQTDSDRQLSQGAFALQAHDPGSTVHFKNLRVKRLD